MQQIFSTFNSVYNTINKEIRPQYWAFFAFMPHSFKVHINGVTH